jgi:predicted DNA-binding transcriptional regulator AlpA
MSDIEKDFLIEEWCEKRRISRAYFYVLKKQGKGPRELRLGKKILITRQADLEWQRAREAEQATV